MVLTDAEVKVVLCELASMVLLTSRKLDLVIAGSATTSELQNIDDEIRDINSSILQKLSQ